LIVFASVSSSNAQFKKHFKKKKVQYAEVNFEDLMQRYFEKVESPMNALEGVYSVSCVITKRSKPFLSSFEKTKVMGRKDNYARVAILKDRPGKQRDYIEVSLSFKEANKYPIMGEFSIVGDGRGLIYKHMEGDGSMMTFSMVNEPDLMEGKFSVVEGRKIITYHLSYLRIFPKTSGSITLSEN
jgi:hypothetical protein